jgi:hypothetical protein
VLKIIHISRESLFKSAEGKRFPTNIFLLADLNQSPADIDVIISSHRQAEAVNLTVENYLALEKKARTNVLIVESSPSLAAFRDIKTDPRISKILILSPILNTTRLFARGLRASNGAALTAQIGHYLGKSRYTFFSHSDMIAYRQNFLSFLLSKLDDETVIASFTQRHVLPFSGGMLYDRSFSGFSTVDWLPKKKNPYHIPGLDKLRERIQPLEWIDAGEQLILEALARGKRAYVCASRGLSSDYFGNPIDPWQLDVERISSLDLPIDFAPLSITRREFDHKYPQLLGEGPSWRKCFDDDGEVVFVHRGRGSRAGSGDSRGDFVAFTRAFNQTLAR